MINFKNIFIHQTQFDIQAQLKEYCFILINLFQIGGLTILNQEFGESVFEPSESFLTAKFDGVLGMSYQSLAEILGTNVFDNMIAQKLVDQPVFSFYLSRCIHIRSSPFHLN